MSPESFVVDSDAWLSSSGCDVSGNCRCPRCHEWPFTEREKEHASGIGYSHDAREMVQVVVELPLREELLRLGAVSGEYVRGLSEKSVISSPGVAWGRSSCSGGVSSPAASSVAASPTASSATSSAVSSAASPAAWGVFSSGSLDV